MTTTIAITSNESLKKQACNLAEQWGFHYTPEPYDQAFFLQLTTERLQLIQTDKHSPGPIFTDFTAGQIAHRRLFGGGKGQTIAKAVGLHKYKSPLILDATAGMGKDAFVFASLGAQVILMERSPVAAALLSDALQHAAAADADTAQITARMNLLFADARTLLLDRQTDMLQCSSCSLPADKQLHRPDVIYLDPMFPHRKKSAQVKKEMLAFQSLIGDDKDSAELLSVSRKIAKKRVVVKRPGKAPFLADQQPTLSMKMKKHRFDIYISY